MEFLARIIITKDFIDGNQILIVTGTNSKQVTTIIVVDVLTLINTIITKLEQMVE